MYSFRLVDFFFFLKDSQVQRRELEKRRSRWWENLQPPPPVGFCLRAFYIIKGSSVTNGTPSTPMTGISASPGGMSRLVWDAYVALFPPCICSLSPIQLPPPTLPLPLFPLKIPLTYCFILLELFLPLTRTGSHVLIAMTDVQTTSSLESSAAFEKRPLGVWSRRPGSGESR